MRSCTAIIVGARVAEERIVAGTAPAEPGLLPAGTVTFLFTDIEGSTRLLAEAGETYATLLEDHRRLLRNAFAVCGGHEVDTQGDSFFVAFASAPAAVMAAVQSQRDLAAHQWPAGRRVRDEGKFFRATITGAAFR